MAAIFVLMAREEGTRVQLYWTGGLTLLLAAVGFTRQKLRGPVAEEA